MKAFFLFLLTPLSFFVSAQTNTVWDVNAANIGIGTLSPQYNLDVNGKMRITATTTDPALSIVGSSSFNGNFQLGVAAGNNSMGINALPSTTSTLLLRQKSSSASNPVLVLQATDGSVGMDFIASAAAGQLRSKGLNLSTSANGALFRVTPANNVGAEQIMRFHAASDITKASGSMALVSIGALGGGTPIGKFKPTTGSASFTALLIDPIVEQSPTATGNIYGLYYNPILTSIGSSKHYGLYINSGQNYFADLVTIGTTQVVPAGYKLAVGGNIIAEKVKVQVQPWADYVFEPTYKLPSLEEVEAFIKANKHLPDVPTAKEVEKNGLDLGDNQAVLLKKVEELTLYIIEQHKKIESLSKEVASLKEKQVN